MPAIPPDPPPGPGPEPEPDPQPDPEPQPPNPDAGAEDPDEPAALPDFAAPSLQLAFPERAWLRRLRRTGKLRVKVTVDEPAAVDLRLLRRKRGIARAVLETGTGTRIVYLRPRAGALRWLRDARAPRLRFSVVATDAAKNDSVWTRVLHR